MPHVNNQTKQLQFFNAKRSIKNMSYFYNSFNYNSYKSICLEIQKATVH